MLHLSISEFLADFSNFFPFFFIFFIHPQIHVLWTMVVVIRSVLLVGPAHVPMATLWTLTGKDAMVCQMFDHQLCQLLPFQHWSTTSFGLDIDECSGSHGCEQECVNSPGSFICSCRHGYSLDDDGRTCNLTGESNLSRCWIVVDVFVSHGLYVLYPCTLYLTYSSITDVLYTWILCIHKCTKSLRILTLRIIELLQISVSWTMEGVTTFVPVTSALVSVVICWLKMGSTVKVYLMQWSVGQDTYIHTCIAHANHWI